MTSLTRFGRKVPLPSTRQIRHELMTLMLEDARLKENAREKAPGESVTPAPAGS